MPNQLIEIKWRKDNREWYEGKGYQYTKTGDTFFVKAEDLMYGSDQKVKVQCDYCGDIYETINHEYTNSIKTTKKCACNKPECKGQKISETKKAKELNARKELLDLFYQKCEQMGYTPITTIDEFQHTRASVSFECPKHGVVTISSVKYFLNSKYGCPECGREHIGENQGLSIDEVIAIVESKNGDKIKNPEEYKTARTKNLIITCGKCGKDFLSSLMNIQEGSGQCFECAHKDARKNLRRSKEELIEIIESKNNNTILNPDDYVDTFTPNLIIECGKCGNVYMTSLSNYLQKPNGECTLCSPKSYGEELIASFLNSHSIKYIREKKFDGCKDINLLPFDFYLPDYNLCIEFDGKQHYEPVFGEKQFLSTLLHDGMKNNFCKWNGINLLRISYLDGHNIDAILEDNLEIKNQFPKIEYVPTAERKKQRELKEQNEEIKTT